MKILLLGEFSGLHNNLKDGLIDLGHEVVIASAQDGFKKIPVDINFESNYRSIFREIGNKVVRPILNINKLKDFDIVQIINPFEFYSHIFPSRYFLDQVIKNNKKTFLLAAGSDSYFWRNGRKLLNYGPFDESLKYDYKSSSHYMESDTSYEYNKYIVNKVCGVIPIMYEYELSYTNEIKLLPTIPIPINIDNIRYEKNMVNDKIIVFHGLNRYGFKGTRFVEDAFSYLQNKYPNELELRIEGKLPLDKYLEILRQTNVVIDQVLSYSLGVNGLFALAMGKVVLGGAEPESLNSLGITDTPVFNIKPTKESIVDAIEFLILNKQMIPDIGHQSRLFVEKNHNYKIIAKQYLDTWNSTK